MLQGAGAQYIYIRGNSGSPDWVRVGFFGLKAKNVVLAIAITFWYNHTGLKKIYSGIGSTSIFCYG